MIYCKICGKDFKDYRGIAGHLKLHKITAQEYYDKFLRKEAEGICPICGRETSFRNINKGYCKFCSHKCAKFGKYCSEETRKKISSSLKDKMAGKKHPLSGRHLSEETKKKISDANKGENNPNYGKHRSEETRKKISEAQIGKHPSEETKKKMSDARKGKMKGIENSFYGKHHTEEARKKMSEKKKGKNHPNYKDGVSMKQFEGAYGLSIPEWKELAQKIRKRDSFTCQLCGKKKATDVHHIIPRRVRIDNDPSNLITLCKSCHSKIEYLTDKYLAEGKDPREIFIKME
jgi:endogenous inhibitor of DNA gyrase (YacG/DUF329 family)/uncharacterized protein YlaI